MLKDNDLPDFATPSKELLPGYERSPKIGYAATDLLPIARDPAVLAIEQDWFGVLKTADDLKLLSRLGKSFWAGQIVQGVWQRINIRYSRFKVSSLILISVSRP